MRVAYVTPVLVTKLRMGTPGQADPGATAEAIAAARAQLVREQAEYEAAQLHAKVHGDKHERAAGVGVCSEPRKRPRNTAKHKANIRYRLLLLGHEARVRVGRQRVAHAHSDNEEAEASLALGLLLKEGPPPPPPSRPAHGGDGDGESTLVAVVAQEERLAEAAGLLRIANELCELTRGETNVMTLAARGALYDVLLELGRHEEAQLYKTSMGLRQSTSGMLGVEVELDVGPNAAKVKVMGYDTTGDGVINAFDTNRDGHVDALDTTGDGRADTFDTTHDGQADAFDTTHDGHIDAHTHHSAPPRATMPEEAPLEPSQQQPAPAPAPTAVPPAG